ncbi:MAG: acylphosphatase [Sciscionella sp.]|nr:acylphosphatase [Sciscionella sp.]
MATDTGSPDGLPDKSPVRLTAWVHGHVQGVGFRWWTRSRALRYGITGSARNLPDGRVEVVAEGTASACRRLLAELRSGDPPGRVDTVVERWSAAKGGLVGFVER